MNSQNSWNGVKKQLSSLTKGLSAKTRSTINNDLCKKATSVMEGKSLSLLHDDFGVQMYEFQPNIKNYISCKKNGFELSIERNENNIVKKELKTEDSFKTDFIETGTLKKDEVLDARDNLKTGFVANNDYLYKNINQEKIKGQVFDEGVEEIKSWFNKNEIKKIQKENKDFVGLLK